MEVDEIRPRWRGWKANRQQPKYVTKDVIIKLGSAAAVMRQTLASGQEKKTHLPGRSKDEQLQRLQSKGKELNRRFQARHLQEETLGWVCCVGKCQAPTEAIAGPSGLVSVNLLLEQWDWRGAEEFRGCT